ncbi:MAG: diacylglycerol kinase family lipid kinase [Actinomycetes bacterium]|jgi:YegS/Rv2252/BmrU family lipid kinase|nr:diacylglycerol kinase family lipid kinase [Actinomycetes bacterium]
MNSYRIIINPCSDHSETARLLPAIEELFSGAECEFLTTQAPGHARQLAAETPPGQTVVAVGGDGTVHEVLAGLMTHPSPTRPVLGIIPTGSGNDAALAFGLPNSFGLAGAAVLRGEARAFDVGCVNGHWFASSFSVGLDALVVSKTVEYKARHNWSGARLYYSALLYVITHQLKSIDLEIAVDSNDPVTAGVLLSCVTNGRTYGGGIPINPDAVPDDGRLTLAWIDNLSVPASLARLPLITRGAHTKLKVYHMRQIERAVLQSAHGGELIAQADGELFSGTRFEVGVHPGAIRVIIP